MKKYKVLVALACVALLVVGSMAPAVAKGAKAKGAVAVVLTERNCTEGWSDAGAGPPAGRANINTAASGKVQVQIHMYDAAPGTYDVYVGVKADGVETMHGPLALLIANSQGNGNAHVEVDIPAVTTNLVIMVVVKPTGAQGKVGYTNGYTAAVPLKK